MIYEERMKIFKNILKNNTILQFIRFCIVGGSGMVVDMGITFALTEIVGLDPRLSAVFGFALAVINNYIFNRLWTFKNVSSASHTFSFSSFFIISTIGMAISIGIMHLVMVYFLPQEGFQYLIARFIGIVVATFWNFFGSKFIAFKQ
jgi:putative flippase GtrA